MSAAPGETSSSSTALFAETLEATVERHGFAEAIRLCQERIASHPSDADAYRYSARFHILSGRRDIAVRMALRACDLAPTDPRTWSDLGRVHAVANDFASAAESFTRAVEVDPRYADGWHNLGMALHKLEQLEPGLTAFKNALLIEPDRADTYLALGNLLVTAGQLEDAVESFERAAARDPGMARARSSLAEQLSQRGKVKRAERLFRQSLGLNPHHIEGWVGLARTLEDLGEREAAVDAYINVLRRMPDHPLALGQYLALVSNDATPEWLGRAETALENSAAPDESRALIGYGLAKYYDRRADFAAAAEAGTIANAARRRTAGPLDRRPLAERVDGLISTYTAEFFSERRRFGLGADQPIFIVGLPRSGTSLTEQIIAAHPLAHGAGELPTLAQLAVRCVEENQAPWRAAAQLEEGDTRVLAGEYLRALRDGAPIGRLRITDKSPLNFFHLAFVTALFPNAHVLHCRRSSRDTALSIWLENFNIEQRYATDFDDMAFFIQQYQRVMQHWRAVLPLRILEIQYEATVRHVEQHARQVMRFLGLPWDDRCLNFHAHSRAVQTPSRWQVRQPIYQQSVGRWRNYATHLPALERTFQE